MTRLAKLPSPSFRYSGMSKARAGERVRRLSLDGFHRIPWDSPNIWRGEMLVGVNGDSWNVLAIPHGSRGPHQ